MSSLPVLVRELRVRARKPWTSWLRVIVALLATLMAVSTLAWAQQATWTGTLPGKTVFDSLAAVLLVFCLVEGVRQTADCLSVEKREGTLGLLFLTELSGLDVVLGKLAATSLGSCYGFMAVFPVMAMALTAGGLTGGEFWRTVLVLLNALFFALACGMWVSARQREEGRALLRGLAWIFGATFLPWLVEPLLRPLNWPNLSMSVALQLADDAMYRTHAGRFWGTLATGHVLAWVLLLTAGRIVESSWREDGEPADDKMEGGSATRPPVRPPRLGPAAEEDAAEWLAARTWRHRGVVWLMMLLMAVGPYSFLLVILFRPAGPGGIFTALHYSLSIVPLVVLLFVASRPFAEARRNGAMELLLSTPLSPSSMVKGYWRALWHRAPGIVVIAVIALVVIAVAPALANVGTGIPFYLSQSFRAAQQVLTGVTACWLGLYLGLRTESALRATGYGLLWLVAVPWVASSLLWMMLRPFLLSRFTGPIPVWYWLVQVIPTLFGIVWLVLVMRWARRQLLARFRELAAGNR